MDDYFLRLPQVTKKTGLAKSTIYKKIREGTFPAPIKLATRLAVWKCTDIEEWMEAQCLKR